jgi:hypothetical protein
MWFPEDGVLKNYTREGHSYTGKTQFNFGEIPREKLI